MILIFFATPGPFGRIAFVNMINMKKPPNESKFHNFMLEIDTILKAKNIQYYKDHFIHSVKLR